MAKHQFGIMKIPPQKGVRYDEYEPDKYDCIDVDDKIVEILCSQMRGMPTYYHSLDISGENLAYCGITLIPPSTSALVVLLLNNMTDVKALKNLFEKASKENKFVIHFGL